MRNDIRIQVCLPPGVVKIIDDFVRRWEDGRQRRGEFQPWSRSRFLRELTMKYGARYKPKGIK